MWPSSFHKLNFQEKKSTKFLRSLFLNSRASSDQWFPSFSKAVHSRSLKKKIVHTRLLRKYVFDTKITVYYLDLIVLTGIQYI